MENPFDTASRAKAALGRWRNGFGSPEEQNRHVEALCYVWAGLAYSITSELIRDEESLAGSLLLGRIGDAANRLSGAGSSFGERSASTKGPYWTGMGIAGVIAAELEVAMGQPVIRQWLSLVGPREHRGAGAGVWARETVEKLRRILLGCDTAAVNGTAGVYDGVDADVDDLRGWVASTVGNSIVETLCSRTRDWEMAFAIDGNLYLALGQLNNYTYLNHIAEVADEVLMRWSSGYRSPIRAFVRHPILDESPGEEGRRFVRESAVGTLGAGRAGVELLDAALRGLDIIESRSADGGRHRDAVLRCDLDLLADLSLGTLRL